MLKELNGIKIIKKQFVDNIRIQESENITNIETKLEYLFTQDQIEKADVDYVFDKMNGVFTNSCSYIFGSYKNRKYSRKECNHGSILSAKKRKSFHQAKKTYDRNDNEENRSNLYKKELHWVHRDHLTKTEKELIGYSISGPKNYEKS